ncbi:Methylenetetrahydrofolate reductase 2 [Venturia nashicola]|uniref:Methylenetetrahydrofolate reductase 2 n=1 Tax=Venturia nashicola TaxID=86259 RepID=A0A4Z1P9I1_9PEZI|nr:Methylenetetrahydrofolate reductase 2 [Venturia nashicola]
MDRSRRRGRDKGSPLPIPPQSKKNDEFYKYWDRFTRVKEKKESLKKNAKKIGIKEGKEKSSKAETEVETKDETKDETKGREGPSLDRDVEGRPGHPMVRSNTEGVISRQKATTSYDEAAASCRAKVEAIRRECLRLNQKYYDRLFDLPCADTLTSLDNPEKPCSIKPLQGVGSVKRVEDIYDDPEFFVDGATANDVKQGTNGDCWFLAGITALSGKPELIEKLCIARDEKVGVYGFVFFRDGEWISEVVDDRLALRHSGDERNYVTEYLLRVNGDKNVLTTPLSDMAYGIQTLEKDFRESLRKGSNALYFASCKDGNETWLPLLEKAYAKAHGDYQAIEGGFAGEGIEDLTGGIATYIVSEDVLDKDKLWSELLEVNDKFLFGCGSRQGRDNDPADEEGFVRGHAYTVLSAREITKPANIIAEEERAALKLGRKRRAKEANGKLRLLKLRNPWGSQEWNGAWSDGSKEWTPDVMKELDHTFGDDGIFWISYKDFLKFYPEIDRIRLIGPEWTVTQQWTAVSVPWTADYLDTSFSLEVTKAGPVVLILSQPDDRYFQGFTGRYKFDLHFRLYADGEDTYLLRSMAKSGSSRSCSAELDLEPGKYTILVKVTADRFDSGRTAEEVIREFREARRNKLLAVGKSFDAIHEKGRLREMEETEALNERKDAREDEIRAKKKRRVKHKRQRARQRAMNLRLKTEEKRKNGIKKGLIREEAREKRKAERLAKKKETEEKRKVKIEEKKKNKAEKFKTEAGTSKVEGGKPKDAEVKEDEAAKVKGDTEKKDEAAKVEGDTEKKEEGQATDGASKAEHISTTGLKTVAVPEKVTDDGSVTSSAPGQPTPEATPEASSNSTSDDSCTQESSIADTKDQEKVDAQVKNTEQVTGPEKQDISTQTLENDKKDDTAHPPTSSKEKPHDDNDDDALSEVHSCKSESESEYEYEPESESESEDDTISNCSSVADSDFSWDSAIDGPDTILSDTDGGDSADEDDMFKEDPWKARCVIGLRVCSLDALAAVEVGRGEGGHEGVEG